MNGEIKALTGMRGLAILFVYLSHSSKAGINLFSALDFSGAGRYGVFMFFVLSAYLLTKQFLDTNIKTNITKYIITFFIKRILRIYPLFILSLLIYYMLYKFGYKIWDIELKDVWLSILLSKGIGVFWAIPVEFQYYFIIPFVSVYLLKYSDNIIGVTVFSFLFLVVYTIYIKHEYQPNVIPFLSIFYMGSYLAYIQNKIERYQFTRNVYYLLMRIFDFLSIIMFSIFILLVPSVFTIFSGEPVPLGYFHHHFILLGLLSSILIFSVINSSGVIYKLLSSDIMCFIGRISFSMYLGHYIIIAIVYKYIGLFPGVLSFLVCFLLTISLSWVSYRVIEKPLFDLRHKVII